MILISFISFLCGFTTSSNRFAKKRNRNGIILELRISPKEGKTTKEILNKKEQREMKKQIEIQIENEFRKIERSQMKKYPLLRGCIRDGILYPEQYEKSPFKMLVLLKEPYDEWDDNTETPIGGDFGFVDVIYNLETHCQEGLNKTWRKIAAIAYALKEGTKYTEDLSYEQIKETYKALKNEGILDYAFVADYSDDSSLLDVLQRPRTKLISSDGPYIE